MMMVHNTQICVIVVNMFCVDHIFVGAIFIKNTPLVKGHIIVIKFVVPSIKLFSKIVCSVRRPGQAYAVTKTCKNEKINLNTCASVSNGCFQSLKNYLVHPIRSSVVASVLYS